MGRTQHWVTYLSRCEASLCAVGSVLCSCLRVRSLANSPWQSCTPAGEKQKVTGCMGHMRNILEGTRVFVSPIFNTDPDTAPKETFQEVVQACPTSEMPRA